MMEPAETRIRIFIEHHGRLFNLDIFAEDFFGDEDVHV